MSNPLKYIDCHTHAQFAAYKDDREEVIRRAIVQGVAMINVGTQRDTSKEAVDLARKYENVWVCVGLHPIHTEKSFHDEQELGASPSTGSGFTSRGEDFDYEYYKKLALDDRVVAIGECGLDYYHVSQNIEHAAEIQKNQKKQKETFIKQIELAFDVKKPLMIHCRGSASSPSDVFADLIEILEENRNKLNDKPGIVHFFSGTTDHAEKLLDLGFYFTFGGVITFPPKAGQRTGAYDEVIKMIPMERILSETDAPYVTPEPYRGKRNEPAYVIYVVRKLAELKGVSEEDMAVRILANAKEVFRF